MGSGTKSIENSIDIDYRIDNKKSINLNFRNFLSVADYDEVLFKLKDDGYREISEYALLESNPNTNFNIWNLDVKFQWWFSPGSNLIFYTEIKYLIGIISLGLL